MKNLSKIFQRLIAAVVVLLVTLNMVTIGIHAQSSLPDGYVTISFVDYGIRVQDELDEGTVDFPKPLGEIIAPTSVPFYKGESIATVTLRLLDSKSIGYSHTGSAENSFYLAAIKNFKAGQKSIASFGEFDAGSGSGWMITLNNWFINMSTSDFTVEDGDIIQWQYTCQLGADIGSDWSNHSAKITGLKIDKKYGVLSPAFSSSVNNYTLTVPSDIQAVKIEALQENYWAKLTYRVGSTYYKLLRDIPVTDGTQIVIESAFAEYAGNPPTDTDKITITVKISATSVTVAPAAISLLTGETKQLTATITPANANKAVTWSSSDATVAAVSSTGMVTAKRNGKAQITVKTNAGSKTSACTVTVGAPFISIAQNNTALGDTLLIKVPWYILYKKASVQLGFITNIDTYVKVEWTSDNAKVSVDKNGKITNTKTGARSTKITVKMFDSANKMIATDSVRVIFYKFKWQLDKQYR